MKQGETETWTKGMIMYVGLSFRSTRACGSITFNAAGADLGLFWVDSSPTKNLEGKKMLLLYVYIFSYIAFKPSLIEKF